MLRPAIFTALLAVAVPFTQAQIFSRGAPASATSPEPDGRQHGVPASVVSPTPRPFGVNPPLRTVRPHGPLRRFGDPKVHHTKIVPVPIFFPVYGYGYGDAAYPVADPSVADAAAAQGGDAGDAAVSDDELNAAYMQGAHDALAARQSDRYGQHYLDSREKASAKPSPAGKDKSDNVPSSSSDDSPSTVFIFKDGHQIETRNFAIMGQTLYDFSTKNLRKVELTDLDTVATQKANDDRGIAVKLPATN